MEWLANIWVILLVGGLPTVLSVTLGTYWLKNERFPWEKPEVEKEQYESFIEDTIDDRTTLDPLPGLGRDSVK